MALFFGSKVREGQRLLQEKIKELLEGLLDDRSSISFFSPAILRKERVFLEPQLFSFFSSGKRNYNELARILLGYANRRKIKGVSISLVSNSQGVIDIPQVGYFLTRLPNKKIRALVLPDGSIQLNRAGKEVPCKFQPIIYIGRSSIEIRLFTGSFYSSLIKKTETAGREKLQTEFYADVDSKINYYIPAIESSMSWILRVAPQQFREINDLCRTIIILKGTNLIAFTALEMHGVIFLRPRKSDTRIFFAEHIIHEVSHIAMNSILINIKDFFKVDPFSEKYSSPFRKDLRGIYQVLQAAFVLSKIAQFFSLVYSGSLYKKEERYEVIGRLMLSLKRLKESLDYIDDEAAYTAKGRRIFEKMSFAEKGLNKKHRDLFLKYGISKQKVEFNLKRFLTENKLVHL